MDVKESRQLRIGGIRDLGSRHAERDVILRSKELVRLVEQIRLVVSIPHEFESCVESWIERAAGLSVPLVQAGLVEDACRLLRTARVKPYHCGFAQQVSVLVDRDVSHAVSIEGDDGNFVDVDPRLGNDILGSGDDCVPPIVWLLLSPARLRILRSVGLERLAEKGTIPIVENDLASTCSHVVSDDVALCHACLLLVLSRCVGSAGLFAGPAAGSHPV